MIFVLTQHQSFARRSDSDVCPAVLALQKMNDDYSQLKNQDPDYNYDHLVSMGHLFIITRKHNSNIEYGIFTKDNNEEATLAEKIVIAKFIINTTLSTFNQDALDYLKHLYSTRGFGREEHLSPLDYTHLSVAFESIKE